MDEYRRVWYELAALAHRKHEHEIRQEFLNALGQMLGGEEA